MQRFGFSMAACKASLVQVRRTHSLPCPATHSCVRTWGCRRRDLEAARTLADQVRKREKLKKRELQLYKEEWAARMQGEPGPWTSGPAACLLLAQWKG